MRTASAGKSRRGRFYIGGLWENDVSGNSVVVGAVDHGDALDAYIVALARYVASGASTALYRLVVHSHKLSLVPGTQCQDSSTPVTGFIRRVTVGTMRSRMPGHGT